MSAWGVARVRGPFALGALVAWITTACVPEIPGRACGAPDDCFRAEQCIARTCVPVQGTVDALAGGDAATDAGPRPEAGLLDQGRLDQGGGDASVPDAQLLDGALLDATELDATELDATEPDAAQKDAAAGDLEPPPDLALPDAAADAGDAQPDAVGQ